ncbi:hypothetical protein ALC57_16611, partial [Trachymyrmex cornetzi]
KNNTVTSKFLVLTSQLIFQFTGLIEFGIYTLQFLLFITKIALALLIHGEGFLFILNEIVEIDNIIPGAKKLRSTHDDVLHLQDDDEHRRVDPRFASLDS